MAFIAGQYVITYNAVGVGVCDVTPEAPLIEQQSFAEMIDGSDQYGDTAIDAIFRGGNWFAQFTSKEYGAGPLAAFWPFGTLGQLGIVARLYTAMASALVFTAVTGTPAAANPATVTANKAILAPGYNTRLLFGPTLRKVPVRLQLFPYAISGPATAWFTQT